MTAQKSWRKRVSTVLATATTALLVASGIALAPAAAQALDAPVLSVTPSTGLTNGDTVTVTGSGYNPNQAIYVTTCTDTELANVDFTFINSGCTNGAKLVYQNGALDNSGNPRPLQFSADGSFTVSMPLVERSGSTALYTIANHTAMQDRTQDAKATLSFGIVPATPAISGVAAEVANDRVDFAVTGSGFDDVAALPGQTEPHVYVKLSEKGSDLSTVGQDDPSLSTTVANGAISGTLSVPAAGLDRTKSYELISWPSRSFPTEANVYARADVTINWDALFPAVAPVPAISGVATEVANDRVDFAVSGTGFDAVQALPGQSEPHVYVKLSEKGSDLSNVGQDDPSLATTVSNGAISGTLSVPAAGLDRTKSYELISWPSRSFPTEANVYARADVTINWDALFPVVAPVAASTTTAVTFSPSTFAYNVAKTANVTVKAKGSSAVPTGKVALRVNGVTHKAVTLKAGKASIKLPKLVNVGSRTVAVIYTSGDLASFKNSTGTTKIKVTKATPKVSSALAKSTVSKKQNATVKVAVTVPGSLKAKASKIKVQVFDGSKKIKTATLNSAGKVNVKLPKLKAGSHKIKVKFVGNSNIKAKSSVVRTLKVK